MSRQLPRVEWTRRLALTSILCCVASAPCFAQARASVDDVLARAGKHVEGFVEQFSAVKCTERVSQSKLGYKGRVELKTESVFDYLALLQAADGDLSVNESRLEQSQTTPRGNASLLVSNGFATLLMVFHPYYRASFQFDLLPEMTVGGKTQQRVQFRHLPGASSPTVLLLRGREYPLDLVGEAWIDAESGAVTRITASLEAPMEDLGLRIFRSEVQYAPISFRGMQGAYWLPTTATVEVRTPRQHWVNTHQFTNYQRFSVDSQATVGGPR
jgi:hypothetical protein